MRQTISGLIAAAAVMIAGAAPASACGYGGCSPCGWGSPCAQVEYVPAPAYLPTVTVVPTAVYTGCGTCGGWGGWVGWGYERLAEPTRQYYYVNQGPTYSGPGAFAPLPTYQENAIPYYGPNYYGAGRRSAAAYRWHHQYHYYPLRRYN